MTAACSLLDAELALDRIEAELASELPPYMRAFAAAYVAHTPPPPAPPVLTRPSTVVALRQAMAHPILEDRARLIARLVFPAAIDDDPRVATIRARAMVIDGRGGRDVGRPSWDDYAELAAARDVVARERFDTTFVALMHQLHGATPSIVPTGAAWPPPIAGWHERGAVSSDSDIDAMWRDVVAPYRLAGALAISRGRYVRARTFVAAPKREVIVALPDVIETPAARFAVLHEFGHALVALLVGEVPRVVDEGVAAFVARRMEQPASAWFSEHARFARSRRREVALALDAIERGVSPMRPTERPPWALWHDPGAQAAYVEAEVIADTLDGDDLAASIASKMRR